MLQEISGPTHTSMGCTAFAAAPTQPDTLFQAIDSARKPKSNVEATISLAQTGLMHAETR